MPYLLQNINRLGLILMEPVSCLMFLHTTLYAGEYVIYSNDLLKNFVNINNCNSKQNTSIKILSNLKLTF